MKNAPAAKECERCAICGRQTAVPVSTPVDVRKFYVIGCGQLCNACFQKLTQPTPKKTADSGQ